MASAFVSPAIARTGSRRKGSTCVVMQASDNGREARRSAGAVRNLAVAAVTGLLVAMSPTERPEPADALPTPRLPPINKAKKDRCSPSSSAMGQANAARDELLDLRECDLRSKDLRGYDIAGALMQDANLQGADLTEAVMSKAFAVRANFKDATFVNAVVDRVIFDGSDLTGANFTNAVLSDSTFDGATLTNVDFTDVYVGDFLQRAMCKNPTLTGENPTTGTPTRESLGCR
eukprot:CAMPEP_0198327520 /NCGR_PEP_ID=MMETSP1450-20131203/14757_1 /TAXON_ID=753684 ORGANISM="Madagascaria erythrocladiodes, Strain CCMP3234" /NCGR_SAMPLE_ID=MMETSP1450 /ASSEMBLY_ACC=CAM_ASM_001115 /LENGTH=231 /DNA_ID=CAMNT_0044031567 /DNA_START=48 /DNA_END=743 /DNA_ORIENTATION=-